MLAALMFNRDFTPLELQDYVALRRICISQVRAGFAVVTM